MIEISLPGITERTLNTALTLYMMLILLRWLGPWLQLEAYHRWLRWGWRLTDPLIRFMRSRLPHMGPMDFAPIAALFAVFLLRLILTQMI